MSSVDPVVRLLADLDRPARPAVEFQDALLARLLGQLEGAIHHEPEAQTTAPKGWGARVLRVVTRRPGRTALALAAVTGVAAAALFVSSPWKTSPGFLERAQAALTTTKPSILHMKWETRVGTVRRCGMEEIWLDQSPPHRYRYLVDAIMRKPECTMERPIEFGGTQNTGGTLEFHPPNALIATQHKAFVPVDLVARLRGAIRTGRAHDEGTTELDGRTVRRIRLDPPTSCPEVWPHCQETTSGYIYVDPETFYPVALEMPGFTLGRGVEISKIRYLEFEYLPRTAENLALTDIRAQHPNATVWP